MNKTHTPSNHRCFMQNSMAANSDGATFHSLAEVKEEEEEEEPAQLQAEVKLETEDQWSLSACLKMDNVPSPSNGRPEQTTMFSIARPGKQDVKVMLMHTHPPFFPMSKHFLMPKSKLSLFQNHCL